VQILKNHTRLLIGELTAAFAAIDAATGAMSLDEDEA
jgi:hypothetical protein